MLYLTIDIFAFEADAFTQPMNVYSVDEFTTQVSHRVPQSKCHLHRSAHYYPPSFGMVHAPICVLVL
jgi:hypothetical protein